VSSAVTTSTAPVHGSFVATRRGKVTLALLCTVTSLDAMDGAIVNVALPTIRTARSRSSSGCLRGADIRSLDPFDQEIIPGIRTSGKPWMHQRCTTPSRDSRSGHAGTPG
jgi:hypothetical protein